MLKGRKIFTNFLMAEVGKCSICMPFKFFFFIA